MRVVRATWRALMSIERLAKQFVARYARNQKRTMPIAKGLVPWLSRMCIPFSHLSE
jgi:hypothetical protein